MWKWINQHVTSVGQRKNLSPRRDLNLWPPLSTWATENSWRARPYIGFIFDTRSAYCKDQQGRCRTVWWRRTNPRPCTVCDVINFSAQRQLCHLTFVGARNLSNHALASSKPLFANLKILDVFSIYSLQVSSFMYLYHNGALPISLTQIFHTGNQIHQYSTKYSDVYRPQTCRTNIKKNSILSQGPRIWKSLPNNIKSASTFNTSKRVIKPFLRVIFILFIVFFILLVIYSEWQNNKIKIKWNARTIIRQGGRIKRQKICNVEAKMVMKILH